MPRNLTETSLSEGIGRFACPVASITSLAYGGNLMLVSALLHESYGPCAALRSGRCAQQITLEKLILISSESGLHSGAFSVSSIA